MLHYTLWKAHLALRSRWFIPPHPRATLLRWGWLIFDPQLLYINFIMKPNEKNNTIFVFFNSYELVFALDESLLLFHKNTRQKCVCVYVCVCVCSRERENERETNHFLSFLDQNLICAHHHYHRRVSYYACQVRKGPSPNDVILNTLFPSFSFFINNKKRCISWVATY